MVRTLKCNNISLAFNPLHQTFASYAFGFEQNNLVYDNNGNLVTGDSFYREYNELNQLVRIRQGNLSTSPVLEEFTWHPVEERILIKDVYYNNTKNYTVYYISKEYLVIENSTGNYTEKYVYQGNDLVAQVTTDGLKQAVHSDNKGSNHLITDSNGNVVENSFYSPFGETIAGGTSSRLTYEAKEYDKAVQDIDFHFRKYNPAIGKFTQPDTLIQNVYDPQSLNRYAFERNNPQNKEDPTGHCPWCLLFVGGAIVGGVSEYIREASSGEKIDWYSISYEAVKGGVVSVAFGYTIGALTILSERLGYLGEIGQQAYETYESGNKPPQFPTGQKSKKVETKDNLKCKVVNCDNKNGVNSQSPEVNPQNSNTPSISSPSSQTDSSKAISLSAMQGNSINGYGPNVAGYSPGTGYVTGGGTTYPTSNPYFVPGTGNAAWGGGWSNVIQNPSTGKWEIAG